MTSPPVSESAPSPVREDEPGFARAIGMAGLATLFLGVAVVVFNKISPRFLGPGWGGFFVVVGVAMMLFHAARDADVQVRRTYGGFGLVLIALAAIVSLLPYQGTVGSLFLPWGLLGFAFGLIFLLPFGRVEDDPKWRRITLGTIAAAGAILAAVGLIGGSVSVEFLLNYGLILALLGLAYLWAAVGLIGAADDRGYRLGQLIGLVGALVCLVALGRSIVPPLLYSVRALDSRPAGYFVPGGLLLTSAGFLYLLLALGVCSDNRLVVLTRRELASFFYSPVAYIVLFAMTAVGYLNFILFVNLQLLGPLDEGGSAMEPIVQNYMVALLPVFSVIFVVPALTMRLLSEEKRTGTLEVLLTAPLGEFSVVMSKFLAALAFYLLLWVPWALYLVILRVEGGKPFDYRPLLSFSAAMICSGAAFLSIGMFFSSLNRNQIVAAVLTFGAMALLFSTFLLERFTSSPTLQAVFKQLSFVDLWIQSLGGKLYLRDVVLQSSIAAFFLFLTVKVLEARKWT